MPANRMDNVLIVVDDLEKMKSFFIQLGLELEGEMTVEGPEVGQLIGLSNVKSTITMMRTIDGQRIELDKFHTPISTRLEPINVAVNTFGIRRIMFNVDNIDETIDHMKLHGIELIGRMQYEQSFKLAYIRGPEGLIVGLAEQMF